MARIPEAEIERLKAEMSVERLVEASGIELKRSGRDLLGRCPFHEDATASLVVTPGKNLWHCFGCGAAGGPIDWVMKKNGVSFRHAVELLRADASGLFLAADGGAPVMRSRVARLPPPVALEAGEQELLNQVIGYYHETLLESPEALDYLKARGLAHPELIDAFKLGYANRTLGLRLPEKSRVAGAEIRGRLQRIGLYRESGHEHFNGSLVVPVFDLGGNVVEVYGRKLRDDLRAGTPRHLYLPGPHAGVWNEAALAASREIILCEALIDAMTFWAAGYCNVTSAYGVEGVTDDHLAAFKRHGTKRVLIAYDRDEAGERGAAKVAERLMVEGIECYRVQFPKGMDANEYALKVTPADKSLGLAIRKAVWLGQGAPPAESPGQHVEDAPLASDDTPRLAPDASLPTDSAPSLAASPVAVPADVPAQVSDDEVVMSFGERRWRIRGLAKNLSPETLKVNVLVGRGDAYYVDSFDLYAARSRQQYLLHAAQELAVREEFIKADLGRVLLKLEAVQAARIKAALKVEPEAVRMTDDEKAAALDLLKSPELLSRLLADFEACGVVGEATNKLTAYLAATSRLLERPLAVVIQSSSAAGKSSLMDAVLAMMPEEERIKYSALTGQSLFYMGETNLKNKILAIAEEEGASRASYALKLLQSEGELTIASTAKDPNTGNLITQQYRVEGPVMIFLTTTAIEIDEELMNRCLVLSVDEGRQQTEAIHRLQRQKRTLAGLLAKHDKEALIQLHRNAQRLLRPLAVVNPYADRLTFLSDKTRTRRDHEKYLTLIDAIALLHQHQRPVKSTPQGGRVLEYVEVELADIEAANRLAHEVLGRSLDELPPQTRRLLMLIDAMVKERCVVQGVTRADLRFSRREVREFAGLSDTQLRIHLDRLVGLEYLLTHRGARGQSFEYELLYDGDGGGQPRLVGLLDTATIASSRDENLPFAGSSRGQNGPNAGASRTIESAQDPLGTSVSDAEAQDSAETRFQKGNGNPPSYPQAVALAAKGLA